MLIMHLSLSPTGMSVCPLITRLNRKQLVTSLIACGSASVIGRFGFSFVESTEIEALGLITISLSSDMSPASTETLAEICRAALHLTVAPGVQLFMKNGARELSSSVELERTLLSTFAVMSPKK